MADDRERITALSEILLDRTAPLADRDDAATDLGCFADEAALDALIKIATDPSEPEMVVASAGESIAEIWLEFGQFDPVIFAKLVGPARSEAEGLLAIRRPDWLRAMVSG